MVWPPLQEQKLRVYGQFAVVLHLSVQCEQAFAMDTDEPKGIKTPRNFLWNRAHLSVETQAFNKITNIYFGKASPYL